MIRSFIPLALWQSVISFTKITYHTAKIFRFSKKTIVVQILLYMYSTIVNNSKKVIKIVFPNGYRLTITALLMITRLRSPVSSSSSVSM